MPHAKPERRILFKLFGVPFTVDGKSWQFVPPKLIIGLLIAFITLPEEMIATRIFMGLNYGFLLLLALFVHIIGHVLSSREIKAPVREAYITPVLIQVLHHDESEVSSRVHLIRAIGGPLYNLFIFVVSYILWLIMPEAYIVQAFAIANIVVVCITLLPFPSLDGEVIWRELRNMRLDQRG